MPGITTIPAGRIFPVIMEFLFFGLIAFLPLSTEYQFNQALGTDFPDEFIMILLTGIFILLIAYRPALINTFVYRHPLFILLLAHLAWIVIATVFSDQPVLSVKYLLAKTWYVIPFVLLPQLFVTNKKNLGILSLCLLIPFSFVIFQSLVRHSRYGFSFAGINNTLDPFFRNHVNYGAMLICMIPILFAIRSLSGKRIRLVTNWAILLFLAGIFFSYSRGAWLGLLVAAIAWFAIRKKFIHWLLLGSIACVISAFTWLSMDNRYLNYSPDRPNTIWHANFVEHWQATVQMRDLSTAERFYRWIAAIRMSRDNLVTGVGPNNFYDSYKPYAVSAYRTWVSRNEEHSTVHNYFLLLLAEQGVPGLVVFTVLLFAAFWYAQTLYHQIDDRFYKTCCLAIGCVLAMITTVNLLSDLIETDKVGSLFFLCIGILIVIDRQRPTHGALLFTGPSHQTHPSTHSPIN